jgi:hypothetical protein
MIVVAEPEFDVLRALVDGFDATATDLHRTAQLDVAGWSFDPHAKETLDRALHSLRERGWIAALADGSVWAPIAATTTNFTERRIIASEGPPWKTIALEQEDWERTIESAIESASHPARGVAAYWLERLRRLDRTRNGQPAFIRSEDTNLVVPRAMLDLLLDLDDEGPRRLYEVIPHARRSLGIDWLHRETVRTAGGWLRELISFDLITRCAPSYPDSVAGSLESVFEWLERHGLAAARGERYAPAPELAATSKAHRELHGDRIRPEPTGSRGAAGKSMADESRLD